MESIFSLNMGPSFDMSRTSLICSFFSNLEEGPSFVPSIFICRLRPLILLQVHGSRGMKWWTCNVKKKLVEADGGHPHLGQRPGLARDLAVDQLYHHHDEAVWVSILLWLDLKCLQKYSLNQQTGVSPLWSIPPITWYPTLIIWVGITQLTTRLTDTGGGDSGGPDSWHGDCPRSRRDENWPSRAYTRLTSRKPRTSSSEDSGLRDYRDSD